MDIKVVTICGSEIYAKEMQKIARELTMQKGWCIIQCLYGIDRQTIKEDELQKVIIAHYKKIDLSDAIYVANVNGHIGVLTKEEIKYAIKTGKEVIYHENLKD